MYSSLRESKVSSTWLILLCFFQNLNDLFGCFHIDPHLYELNWSKALPDFLQVYCSIIDVEYFIRSDFNSHIRELQNCVFNHAMLIWMKFGFYNREEGLNFEKS